MITIITSFIEIITGTNVSLIYEIDLIVILVLIGLLIFKELYIDQREYLNPEIKKNMGRKLYVVIVPFIYIFCYVLFYRIYMLSSQYKM